MNYPQPTRRMCALKCVCVVHVDNYLCICGAACSERINLLANVLCSRIFSFKELERARFRYGLASNSNRNFVRKRDFVHGCCYANISAQVSAICKILIITKINWSSILHCKIYWLNKLYTHTSHTRVCVCVYNKANRTMNQHIQQKTNQTTK